VIRPRGTASHVILVGLVGLGAVPPAALAQSEPPATTLRIARAQGTITIDGDLSDPAWRAAPRVDTWFETNPADNTPPRVGNVAYLAFDDRFFYAAFEFDDPNPRAIRSPYADHDHINGTNTDYGGVILDTRHDGHSAVLLLASATGVQYDAITDDDGSGEDSSPDFFWESAARITERGWTLELKIPFSSLRYRNTNPQTWGILLYRNYPRDFRYQFFSTALPRGTNCFICRASVLVGLEGLPAGGHVVAAPYVTAAAARRPQGALGTPLVSDNPGPEIGADVKWTPNADDAVDFTANPDFSQIEADTAQISANERFALSYPEKRPFFLEGVELFSTPFRAVYTRTITAPRWGARATGKQGAVGYTVLVADDDGGGSAIVPGAAASSLVPQASGSLVFVGRVKRNISRHFISALVTSREAHDGAGYSRLAGPDFQWRPTSSDIVTGQWLFSETRTPDRPDLSPTWTGATLSGQAALVQWQRDTRHFDATTSYRDITDDFRADTGFMPQVGIRQVTARGGWTVRPSGLVSRQRSFAEFERQIDRDGALIERAATIGSSMDTKLGGQMEFKYLDDRLRSGASTFRRQRFGYEVRFNPSRRFASISVDGTAGEEIDFANSRPGHGATVNISAQLNPTEHLEIAVVQNQRWVDVDVAGMGAGRLFTARVSRIRGTYAFNQKSFARIIWQYVSTDRDPERYLTAVADRSGDFSASALFAYKINWQSVMFIGYGDDRELSDAHRLEPLGRQLFVKMSYAFSVSCVPRRRSRRGNEALGRKSA